jgi:hypothetical protein
MAIKNNIKLTHEKKVWRFSEIKNKKNLLSIT